MFDQIRNLFLLSVSLISLRVMCFRKSYITNDKNFIRFHYLVIRFIFSIYFLILSPNLVSILLGWDGLGLRSYLLVIYYGNSKAYNSGIVTALTNRLGDSLILLSIGFILIYGNWNIYFYRENLTGFWMTFTLILAACTKRAQIPFSAWLPAAIAAPTPVSSLVHSSTLVTAGVYLLIRHNNWFILNDRLYYIIVVGTFTITIASLSALFETDLKKIVALSTLRQLGVIFLALGLGGFILRYFHLLTHAFFKALLFLCTGAIIHRRKDYQDLRMTGNRIFSLPTINSFILISRFRLIGLPFISAFFSKEIILEFLILNNHNFIIYSFIIFGVGLTALYRARFILLVFSFWNLNDLLTLKVEEDFYILKRIMILIIPASLRGIWLTWYLFDSIKLYESIYFIKILVLIFILLSPLIIWFKKANINNWRFSLWSIRRIWLLPFITTQILCLSALDRSWLNFKIFDRGRIKLSIRLFQSIYFINKITFSIKFIYKILIIFVIWLVIIFIIYICKL
jgi:NADH-ubiquinone oxidoreductase chain 5